MNELKNEKNEKKERKIEIVIIISNNWIRVDKEIIIFK